MRRGENFPVPRVTPADQPLTKEPEDSGVKIMQGGGGVGLGALLQKKKKKKKNTQTKDQKAGVEWVKI